jgi:hypothetical protein
MNVADDVALAAANHASNADVEYVALECFSRSTEFHLRLFSSVWWRPHHRGDAVVNCA